MPPAAAAAEAATMKAIATNDQSINNNVKLQ